jgi:hypothetical protein
VSTGGPSAPRLGVRIGALVWRQEVERYDPGSQARAAAERERTGLERDGVRVSELQACDQLGQDGTRLGGLAKLYVPIWAAPPSQRPFAFVFGPGRDERGPYLALVAYGERHPKRGARSVYERAHKRLHGRYPDQ